MWQALSKQPRPFQAASTHAHMLFQAASARLGWLAGCGGAAAAAELQSAWQQLPATDERRLQTNANLTPEIIASDVL